MSSTMDDKRTDDKMEDIGEEEKKVYVAEPSETVSFFYSAFDLRCITRADLALLFFACRMFYAAEAV